MNLPITRPDARRSALAGLIDYAGLFPPASLSMTDAVAGYRSARTGGEAWMVDRFLCPVSRLTELAGAVMSTMTSKETPWSVGVIVDGTHGAEWLAGALADSARTSMFAAEMSGGMVVDVAEVRLPDTPLPDDAISLSSAAFDPAMVFFEVPHRDRDLVRAAMDSIARVRASDGRTLGAKVRCGGVTSDAFPEPEVLAVVILAAFERALPLKATAGLHHPVRYTDPETVFTHHGFINVLAACGIARSGGDLETISAVLAETDAEAFLLDQSGLRWRDIRLSGSDLRSTRESLFAGYGSCSFDEPVEDLRDLGVLPLDRS